MDWRRREGCAFPLGVTWIAEERAYNFALYSKHASGVFLLFYSSIDAFNPILQYQFNPLVNKSGRVWHCRLTEEVLSHACYYAYVVSGPNERGAGHRFDAQKILLDPYAQSVHFPETFSRENAKLPGSNAGRAPLGMLPAKDTVTAPRLRFVTHTSDFIIYEVHVRCFTARANSGVDVRKRGTFAGLMEKIPYLKELGITAVELMPVTQQDPQEGSTWGYMPLSFFALQGGYASGGSAQDVLNEFRAMADALHDANIELILDVVYSHTAEGDETGPTYSFKGIDNSTYYLLNPDWQHYRNDTEVGNTLNCANRYVRKMIVDSLKFWSEEMHADGFRFDLASIFTRRADGSIDLDDPPAIAAVDGALDLGSIRLIAEAWDPVSYQLGRTFPEVSWLQWNGRFRDDVRAFLRGDCNTVASLMARIYGSCDLFPDDIMNAYHPYQSVNFIDCHDGFCLYDLVAYNEKHNQANGHHNADGIDLNLSWNCGWEGDADVPAEVMSLRRRQVKNFCCLLFLSNGTPMFRAGDEFMNTQWGNNNPYNQDNETTWLDWDRLERNHEIHRFFRKMIAFRKAHPSIARSRFWREDIHWYGVGPNPDLSPDSHTLAYCLHGISEGDADHYVMINAFWEAITFHIQEGDGSEWQRVIDTALSCPLDFLDEEKRKPLNTLSYRVEPRSIVVLGKARN